MWTVDPESQLSPVFFGGKRQLQPLGSADYVHVDTSPDKLFRQEALQVVDAGQRLACQRDDEVAVSQTGPLCGTVLLNSLDEQCGGLLQAVIHGQTPLQRDSLHHHSNIAAPDFAIADELS